MIRYGWLRVELRDANTDKGLSVFLSDRRTLAGPWLDRKESRGMVSASTSSSSYPDWI